MVSYPQKVDALTRILEVENFEGMIVFVRTKNETETLAEKLRARGFSATAINGDIVQAQRERTIGQLKDGKLDILVATDVAARGLDVDRISHVVNYDIPTDPESYVHRTGRTGRAGRSGDAISFVTPRERYLLQVDREDHPPAADPDAAADGRGRQRHPAGTLRRRDHRGAVVARTGHLLPRRGVPLRPRARRARGRRRRRAGRRPPGRHSPAARARAGAARAPGAAATGRPGRPRPDRGERPGKRGAARCRRTPLATYRIAVGKRHKVEPRQIVGALANEGGLNRRDFGHISIRPDFSLVELPADLPPGTEEPLASTRISGKLIGLRRDDGPPGKPFKSGQAAPQGLSCRAEPGRVRV